VPATEGRFKDQPIVWRVADDQDIPEPTYRHYTNVFKKLVKAVRPPPTKSAQNTNALDEVPDSTWFTNRIGRRHYSAREIFEGPNVHGIPQHPITVVEGKIEGSSPGFLIDDARGIRYLVKIDTPENPEQQTAAALVTSRIFWAFGYNVPSDHLFHFKRDQLRLAPDIRYRDPKTKRMTRLDRPALDAILARATRRKDGSFRVLVSELLEGKRKGGWTPQGTRKDDPNDRVPHQYLRELRGMRVLAAWLGHTDMVQSNTLDMYVRDQGRGFLRHYLLDFGGAFGGHQSELGRREVGFEHAWDPGEQAKATMTFGTWTRTWERQKKTKWKSMGYFSAKHFNPTVWRQFEKYAPWAAMDRADAYWAAKIIMKFDEETLAALVREAQLSEPGAADYLVKTLMARRNKTAATFLGSVTPLDEFRFEAGKLCMTDLMVKYRFVGGGTLEEVDAEGRVDRYELGSDGKVCLPQATDPRYRILRVRVRRNGRKRPMMQIHYKGGERPRILGIIRVE
jgi:hypothetical protein